MELKVASEIMNIFDYSVTFAELRDQVNLTFFVSGCPYNCNGCSWKGTDKVPFFLSKDEFKSIIEKYVNKCTAIVFLGGEWYSDFKDYIDIAKEKGFKTCLYTGVNTFNDFEQNFNNLKENLDYLKVGRWIKDLGGLNTKNTNQKLYKLNNGKIEKEIYFYEF